MNDTVRDHLHTPEHAPPSLISTLLSVKEYLNKVIEEKSFNTSKILNENI